VAESEAVAVETGAPRRVLIIVENLPCPFDRRVWQEARTLQAAGYVVSIICPKGKGYEKSVEELDGIAIYRHPQPFEASGALGYLAEYSWALLAEFALSLRILVARGFDVVHACNPPDTLFLIGAFYKLFGKKFLFDHHDINPELYEAKFQRRDFFYRLMLLLERLTFKTADVSVATNESYRQIAISRGGLKPNQVFVVRSGPDLSRLKITPPEPKLKNGRRYLVGYVGVMGRQEGIDGLLQAVNHIVYELKRTDVQFGLVGGGTELAAMRALAKQLGVDDYITFTGRVPDDQLLAMLNTADVCVNPDVANEMNDKSTMNKIMEYMALGKPIVQYDLTEGRVSAQDASLYAARNDPKDLARKIVELLDNEPMRLRMGQIGLERVKTTLAWEHEAPRLLAAYDALFR
jgi:glycosyltransferase involved in cell wall biosynthesis